MMLYVYCGQPIKYIDTGIINCNNYFSSILCCSLRVCSALYNNNVEIA